MPTAPSRARTTPTIRDLVETLAGRPGVQASILVGRDGLVIESRATAGVDPEHLAAHVPTLVAAAEELGSQSSRGSLVTSVIEFERGMAIVTGLTGDALLLVLLHAGASVGPLLFEVRKFRTQIAAIV